MAAASWTDVTFTVRYSQACRTARVCNTALDGPSVIVGVPATVMVGIPAT